MCELQGTEKWEIWEIPSLDHESSNAKFINIHINKTNLKQVWKLLMIWTVYQDGGEFPYHWKALMLF